MPQEVVNKKAAEQAIKEAEQTKDIGGRYELHMEEEQS
jgi:hypothetical protein